jgi:hypothetical protein
MALVMSQWNFNYLQSSIRKCSTYFVITNFYLIKIKPHCGTFDQGTICEACSDLLQHNDGLTCDDIIKQWAVATHQQ